jgi:predicted amidohydrolase
MDNVRAAAVQFESIQADKPANLETIRRFTSQAAERDVQLLVFPECCITGYWFLRKLSRKQLGQLAEPVDGPSSATLLELASRHGMTIGPDSSKQTRIAFTTPTSWQCRMAS